MRRTGQSVCGHPHAAAVFSKRSRNASGSSCGPIFCTGMWVGGAGTVGFSPARTSRSIQLRNSSRSSRWFWTRAQNLLSWSALMSISALCCSWWSPASDWMTSANGDPDGEDMMAAAFRLPSPGFGTSVTKFVGRKEADRVGSWRLRYVYLRQINSHRCALCVTRKHQLSRSSPRSLSVFVPTVSLWQLVRSSLHSVSLWTAVPRRLLSGLHANYYNQTQVILILHLTHLLTAVSWVFLPLQTSLNHAPLATAIFKFDHFSSLGRCKHALQYIHIHPFCSLLLFHFSFPRLSGFSRFSTFPLQLSSNR